MKALAGDVRNCGACGCSDLSLVLDLGLQPLPQATPGADDSARYPLFLVRCQRCTLVQLGYIVPQEQLFPRDYPYATGNTKALRVHFTRLAAEVTAMTRPGDLVVDIGANDGTFLRILCKNWKRAGGAAPRNVVMAVEPTDQARRCEEAMIPVVQDYFTEKVAAGIRHDPNYGPAAVITASNVFGHVQDPHDFLDGVTTLLAPDGALVIDNQDWLNVVNGLQIDTIYHEHLRYYSPASLTRLLAMHGLLVISLTRTDMHGGAFRAVAVRELPELEARARITASRLRALVEAAAARGPVYAIAAPTRATSLVNYARIGEFLDCACEVAGSGKIGAVIPGTGVPVVDEERLIRDQPPSALLLAWDLAGTIIPALRRRGYKGNIIIPLPEPRFADG